jgi:Skp family chaperone for outer membrane proteins
MRVVRFLISILALMVVFTVLAFAQTEKPQNSAATKIAFVNTEEFYEKETGIVELVESVNKIEAEFKPFADELNTMYEKIKKLEKELKDSAGKMEPPRGFTNKMVEDKINEYESAVEKLKKRQDELKPFF